MENPNRDFLSNDTITAQQLPNATATLVLGILSIVVCFICGIIALVISNKDVGVYKANPELYDAASFNNIKAGRICAIIGIVIQMIFLTIYIGFIAFAIYYAKDFR